MVSLDHVAEDRTSRNDVILKLASGGMGTVFVGRMRGAMGFEQLVAIKRPHRHLLEDANFRADLLAEATTTARIKHANVVSVRDLEVVGEDVQLVMDYVEGASLADLADAAKGNPKYGRVLLRVVLDAAAGLHAAHEATDEHDRPLGIVHRDVSPANFLVGLDGIARVTDFGIAKCLRRDDERRTATGVLKGKIGYFAPEYVKDQSIDRRADVFALGVIVWEGLAKRRLFKVTSELDTLQRILQHPVPPLDDELPGAKELDAVLARALAKDPAERFPTALAFAEALEEVARKHKLLATHAEVGAFVDEIAGEQIRERRRAIRGTKAEEVTAPIPTSSPVLPAPTGSTVTATVSAVLEEDEPPQEPATIVDPTISDPTFADPTLPDPKKRSRLAAAWPIAAILVVALGGGAWAIAHSSSSSSPEGRTTSSPVTSEVDTAVVPTTSAPDLAVPLATASASTAELPPSPQPSHTAVPVASHATAPTRPSATASAPVIATAVVDSGIRQLPRVFRDAGAGSGGIVHDFPH